MLRVDRGRTKGLGYGGMDPFTPILIAALGGESPLSQVNRIRAGLAAQPGVTVTSDLTAADIIYCNDAGTHGAALQARDAGAKAKLILNVLDVPENLMTPSGDYTHSKLLALRDALLRADAITAISPFTRSQLQRLLALSATVIWNPVKDVSPDKRLAGERPYPYKALMAGRLRDPNKRMDMIGIPALIMAGFEEEEVAVIGGEWTGWGTNLGVVSDSTLNDLYNSVDFVIQPTLNTGLELPPLEGMICGAIPILCYDMSTFGDIKYYPQYWGCYPSATSVAYRLRALMDNPGLLVAEKEHCLTSSEGIVAQFGKDAVARRIVDVARKVMG
jgi:hypothetical protein